MESSGGSEANNNLATVIEKFQKAYEGVKAGDPRLMSLWDAADEQEAKLYLDTETNLLRKQQAIVRYEVVRNRIEMRYTEIPGYLVSLNQARGHYIKIADALEKTRGLAPSPTIGAIREMRDYASVLAE